MFIHIDISVLIIAKLFVEILYSRETALDPVRLLWDSPNPNIPRINSLIIIITSPTIALCGSCNGEIRLGICNIQDRFFGFFLICKIFVLNICVDLGFSGVEAAL